MLQAILAFLATVVTAVQALLIYTEGKAICFNNGCEIVERLTTVPPLYFNVAGFLFFFLLFWCFYLGKSGSEYWTKFAKLLLLAGLVAEAVLVHFQYSIATAFCSYCLIILGLVVLLNVFCGLRQIFHGAVLFTAVSLALFSLKFDATTAGGQPLEKGALATHRSSSGKVELNLFFSSSCPHCEEVIDSLRADNSCSISFNPIERIDNFDFPGTHQSTSYDPNVNLGFLASLSLKEIPVLVVTEEKQVRVISGGSRIKQFLELNCRGAEKEQSVIIGETTVAPTNNYTSFTGSSKQIEDNCKVLEECDEQVQKLPLEKGNPQ